MQSEILNALLDVLGENREEAGFAYRSMHQRLTRFFRLNNGSDPEFLADETMDRLARSAANQPPNGIGSPQAFALGIARHVLQEDARRQIRDTETAREWSLFTESPDVSNEFSLNAIEDCLARMPDSKQELLRTYYEWTGKRKVEHHRQIADRLGLTINALRNRLMRARSELDACVRKYERDVSIKSDITK